MEIASAERNGDGIADLAVGAPDESVGTVVAAGVVQALYGAPSGVSTTDQLWSQGSPGLLDSEESLDLFGDSLGAGDFDSDG